MAEYFVAGWSLKATARNSHFMRRQFFSLLLTFLLCPGVTGQAGGHTLYGDIKVDESQLSGPTAMSFNVLLYSESGDLLLRQTVPINGRYRFLSIRDGRYDVVVEFENVEVARVRVLVNAAFKTDFRQDIELE